MKASPRRMKVPLVNRPVEEGKIKLFCMISINIVVVAGALHWLAPVMVPLILALLLSYVLNPMVDFQVKKLRIPQELAVTVSLLFSLGMLVGFGFLVISSIKALVTDMEHYEDRLKKLSKQASELLDRHGADLLRDQMELAELPISALAHYLNSVLQNVAVLMELLFLIMVFVVYLLLARNPGAPPRKGIAGRIEGRIKRYLTVKFVLSLAVGLACTFFLWLLKIKLAMLFGLIHFVLNFIPNVGCIIATLMPVPLLLISPGLSFMRMTLCVILPIGVHVVVGHGIEPKAMGDSLELHPITIMLCLIFWGMLWGIPGMLLAAPITAACKIFFESLETTRPLAKLLGGNLDEMISDEDDQQAGQDRARTQSEVIELGESGFGRVSYDKNEP